MKYLLADDHNLFRDSLAEFLHQDNHAISIDTVGDLKSVLASDLDSYQLLLIDLKMPGMLGAISVKKIHLQAPNTPILIVSANKEIETIHACFQSGASGYISKSAHGDELLNAVKEILKNGKFHPKDYNPLKSIHLESLSVTQLQLLGHIAQGDCNQKIAASLNLTLGTVKQYVSTLLRKLNVDNRTQAAKKAHKILGI